MTLKELKKAHKAHSEEKKTAEQLAILALALKA